MSYIKAHGHSNKSLKDCLSKLKEDVELKTGLPAKYQEFLVEKHSFGVRASHSSPSVEVFHLFKFSDIEREYYIQTVDENIHAKKKHKFSYSVYLPFPFERDLIERLHIEKIRYIDFLERRFSFGIDLKTKTPCLGRCEIL